MTPDKLPVEMQEQISKDADEYARTFSGTRSIKRPYIAGATAWAPWLVKHNAVQSELHGVRAENERLKKSYDALATVLQEFVSKHEAGLLPDRFVYENAIKILNDGK